MTSPAELSEAHLQDHDVLLTGRRDPASLATASGAVLARPLDLVNSAPSPSADSPRFAGRPNSAPAEPRDEGSSATRGVERGEAEDVGGSTRADEVDAFTASTGVKPVHHSSLKTSETLGRSELSPSTRGEPEHDLDLSRLDLGSSPEPPAGTGTRRDSGGGEQLRDRSGTITDQGRDEGEGEVAPLDPVLYSALNHPRDRFLLLRAEVEMERFLANPSMLRLPLAPPYFQPALNSYQRLLVHRLADMFGITREVEAAPPSIWNAGAVNPVTGQPQGIVVLVKGEATRLPLKKLASHVPALEPVSTPSVQNVAASSPSSTPSIASSPAPSAVPPSASTSSLSNDPVTTNPSSNPVVAVAAASAPAPPQILKILPRNSAAARTTTASSASSSVGTDDDPNTSVSAPSSSSKGGKARKELTLEEREAAYKEARDRIFSQPEPERTATTTTTGASSSTSAAPPSSASSVADDTRSLRSSTNGGGGGPGAGITRPSSAGSTFSRSSAALSLAGSRPSPSIASESGGVNQPSVRGSGGAGGAGYAAGPGHGFGAGYYGGPSANAYHAEQRPGDAWTNEYGYQAAAEPHAWGQPYASVPRPAGYPSQPQVGPHPPIQVTAPPPHASFTQQVPPPGPYPSFDQWGRPTAPPLPSPSLSASSGSSVQRSVPSHHAHASSSAASDYSSGTGGGGGYLMRFADSGTVITPGGTVMHPSPAPPLLPHLASNSSFASPASSMVAGPPSATRSVSSFSSTSQQSLGSSSAGGGGGGLSRNGRGRSSDGGGGGRPQSRRPSGSLASSASSVASGHASTMDERRGSVSDEPSTRRERQPTLVGRGSPKDEKASRGDRLDGGEDDDPFKTRAGAGGAKTGARHPSLPQKPDWVAGATPPSGPTPSVPPSIARGRPVSSNPHELGDPPSLSHGPAMMSHAQQQPQRPPFQPPTDSLQHPHPQSHPESRIASSNGGAPPVYPQTASSQGSLPPLQFHAHNATWSRVPAQAQGYPTGPPPSLVYGGYEAPYPRAPSGPPMPTTLSSSSNWTYAASGPPPSVHAPYSPYAPSAPPSFPPGRPAATNSDDAGMPFPDIRRPPPRSTQLFDPNKPGGGISAAGGGGARRQASRPGSVRNASSGTRTSVK